MTRREDRPFLSTLREVEGQLSVPISTRVRILRELEFDLEGLRGQLEEEGVEREDARVRSLDALSPDGRTIQDLGRIYAPRYQQMTANLAQDRVQQLERTALVILAISVLVAETLVLLRADLLVDPSPSLWPVLGLGGLLFAMAIGEAFSIWVKGDHRMVRHGSQAILVTAGVIMAAGFLGALVDGYRLLLVSEAEGALSGSLLVQWLGREAELLAVSLVLALAGGLAWFILTQWLTAVSEARREVLGLDPNPRAY
jgi:hypothetical protein